jgi:hypothetical protein
MKDYVMSSKEHRHLFELLVWMLVGLSLTLWAVNTFPGIERFWFRASFYFSRESVPGIRDVLHNLHVIMMS